jgi:hypothetical protein
LVVFCSFKGGYHTRKLTGVKGLTGHVLSKLLIKFSTEIETKLSRGKQRFLRIFYQLSGNLSLASASHPVYARGTIRAFIFLQFADEAMSVSSLVPQKGKLSVIKAALSLANDKITLMVCLTSIITSN